MSEPNSNSEINQREKDHLALELKKKDFDLIFQLSNVLRGQPEPTVFYQKVVDLIGAHIGCCRVSLLIFDPQLDELEVVATYNFREVMGLRIPASQGITGYAVHHGELVNVGEVTTDPRYIKSTPNGRSELAIPIILGAQTLGAIDMESIIANAFDRTDVNLISVVASLVALTMRAVQREEQLRREQALRKRIESEVATLNEGRLAQLKALDDRARRLDLLTRVIRSLSRKMSIDELLDELLTLCAEAFEISHCAVLLKDTQQLVRRASLNYDEAAPYTLALGEGITGHVAQTGVPMLVADVTKDPRYITGISNCRAEMAAPMRIFGEVIGVLDAESATEGAFNEEDLDLFESFASQAAVAILSADMTHRPADKDQ